MQIQCWLLACEKLNSEIMFFTTSKVNSKMKIALIKLGSKIRQDDGYCENAFPILGGSLCC